MTKCKECRNDDFEAVCFLRKTGQGDLRLWQCTKCKRVVCMIDGLKLKSA